MSQDASNKNQQHYRAETISIRGGHTRTSEREHSEPIFTTSSYVFESAEMAAQMFAGELSGSTYSRFTNPTVDIFEKRLAALEGGERCIATSSGMAAIFTTIMALLETGDHIVSSRSLFGSTYSLFMNYLPKFGIKVTFVELSDLNAWEAAVLPNTKLFFMETPSNPLTEMGDIKKVAAIAKQSKSIFVVDNCFATPILQQPLKLGADIVVHSATKYIDGQGRAMGGAIIGDNKLVGEQIYFFGRTVGPTLSPFNAWIFLKGIETLPLRMQAHSKNALELALWLEAHPKVNKVFYPGLASHPQHQLAQEQMNTISAGFGGMLAFEVRGDVNDKANAWQVIDQCQMISITGNLGDMKSTITHPASTTHMRLSEDERRATGITQGLIRLSVGLEHIDDIKEDLMHGLLLI